MRSRWTWAVAGFLAASGCAGTELNEDKARAMVEARKDEVSRLEKGLKGWLDALPKLSGKPFECKAPAQVDGVGLDLNDMAKEAHCGSQRIEWEKKHVALEQQFQREWLTRSLADPIRTGMAVKARYPGETAFTLLGETGMGIQPNGNKPNIAPEDGLVLDGRRVGWGWYQTQRTVNGAQVGDETLRPGVHLKWTLQRGDGEVLVDLAMVVED